MKGHLYILANIKETEKKEKNKAHWKSTILHHVHEQNKQKDHGDMFPMLPWKAAFGCGTMSHAPLKGT